MPASIAMALPQTHPLPADILTFHPCPHSRPDLTLLHRKEDSARPKERGRRSAAPRSRTRAARQPGPLARINFCMRLQRAARESQDFLPLARAREGLRASSETTSAHLKRSLLAEGTHPLARILPGGTCGSRTSGQPPANGSRPSWARGCPWPSLPVRPRLCSADRSGRSRGAMAVMAMLLDCDGSDDAPDRRATASWRPQARAKPASRPAIRRARQAPSAGLPRPFSTTLPFAFRVKRPMSVRLSLIARPQESRVRPWHWARVTAIPSLGCLRRPTVCRAKSG
jgi:hypothetical protein